jgi:hypothetical protein
MPPANDDVQVRFGGTTDELNAAVDAAKQKIGEVRDPIDELSEKLSTLGERFLEAFAIDKIAEFVNATGEAALQLQRLADISGLSTDTIQTLQFAMEMTGGNADSAAQALNRFGRAIEEGAAGSGSAYEAFQRLGVSVNELRHASEADIFSKAIDGFKRLGDSAAQAEVGRELFARGFVNMAGFIDQGTSGLQKFKDQLDETSARMNSARVDEMAGMEQELKILKDDMEGFGRTLLAVAGPAIEYIVDKFHELVEWATKWLQEISAAYVIFANLHGLMSDDAAKKYFDAITNHPDSDKAVSGPPAEAGTNRNQEAQAKLARQIQEQYLEDERKMYGEDYQAYIANEQLKVATGKETKDQMLADEIRIVEATQNLELTNLEKQLALYQRDTVEYQKIQDEKLLVAEKFQTELTQLYTKQAELAEQEARKDVKVWADAFNEIGKDWDKVVQDFFLRTETMGQAFQKFAQNMVIQFTEAVTKMVARYAASQLLDLFGESGSNAAKALSGGANSAQAGQNGLMQQFVTWLGALVGITTEQVAGDTVQVAALTANTAALTGLTATMAVSGGGGGGSAVEDLLGVLPAIAAFDTGSSFVPKTGLAKIHQGEIIIPAGASQQIRDGSAQIGGGSADTHAHFHFHTLDSSGVERMMRNNSSAIAGAVRSAARGNNGAMKSAFARM